VPIVRLGLSNPAANTDVALVNFTGAHLVSIVVANKAVVATPVTKVSVYVVPANATVVAQYAYICSSLLLTVGQSFETFRFAVNAGDTVYVRSTTSTTSFSCNAIAQEDAVQPENLAQTFTNKTIRGDNNTLYLESGTTAQRPASAETGYVRFNTETDGLEVKTSSTWSVVGSGATFSGTTDATAASITIDEVAYSAIARLTVTANGTTAYQFNSHYSGDDPTIYVLGGATIAFNLSEASHPFKLQHDIGAGFVDITSGLIHSTTAGTLTTDVNAQGKTSGTLYWNVPVTAASGGYRYICSSHAGMVGTITHKSLSAI